METELERLKRYINEYGDKDLGINFVKEYNNEIYNDIRNTYNDEIKAFEVYPIFYTKLDKTIKYVCPFCHKIHSTSLANFKNGHRYNLGCCCNCKISNKIFINFDLNENGGIDIRKGKGRKFIAKYNYL